MEKERIVEETRKIRDQADRGGYALNPDEDFVLGLVEGILTNRDRYGYDSCPCRLATGDRDKDLPIVCPCDYRDDDLARYNACFCALYVTGDFNKKENPVVPERWDPDALEPSIKPSTSTGSAEISTLKAHVCQVCGYVAVRENPPRKCPVCGVSHERFSEIRLVVSQL